MAFACGLNLSDSTSTQDARNPTLLLRRIAAICQYQAELAAGIHRTGAKILRAPLLSIMSIKIDFWCVIWQPWEAKWVIKLPAVCAPLLGSASAYVSDCWIA